MSQLGARPNVAYRAASSPLLDEMRQTVVIALCVTAIAIPARTWARDVVLVVGDPTASTEQLVEELVLRGFVDETGTIAALEIGHAVAGVAPDVSDLLTETREQFYDAHFADAAEGATLLVTRWEGDVIGFAQDPALAAAALEVGLIGVRALETRERPDEAAALLARLAQLAQFATPDPTRVSDTQSLQLLSAQALVERRPAVVRGDVEGCTLMIDGFVVDSVVALPTRPSEVAVVCADGVRRATTVDSGDEPVTRWVIESGTALEDDVFDFAAELAADRIVVARAAELGVEVATSWTAGAATRVAPDAVDTWVSELLDPPVVDVVVDEPVSERRGVNGFAWTLGATSLVAAGAGAWLESRYLAQRNTVDDCADDDSCVLAGTIVDERRSLRTWRAGADATWATAGILAAGAIGAVLLEGRDARVALAPVLGPTWAMITVGSNPGRR